MFKKFGKVFASVLAICIALFPACSSEKNKAGPDGKYTINYDYEEQNYTVQVTSNQNYSLNNLPVKYGYTFIGLYDAEVGGKRFIDENCNSVEPFKLNRDIKLYVHFVPKTYKIYLKSEDDYIITELRVLYGEEFTLPLCTVVEPNKKFLGWFTEKNGEGEQISGSDSMVEGKNILNNENFDTLSYESLTLYAAFADITHKINLHDKDGDLVGVKEAAHGANLIEYVSDEIIEDKYVYSWGDKDGNEISDGIVYNDCDLYVLKYAHMVTFDSDGESEKSSVLVPEEETIQLPVISKTGYTFQGWSDSSGNLLNETFEPSANCTLVAKWMPNQYTVTLNANGGTLTSDSISVTYGQNYSFPVPNYSAHEFDGWFTSNGAKLTHENGSSYGVWYIAENITAVAQWSRFSSTYSNETRLRITDSAESSNKYDSFDFNKVFGRSLSSLIAKGYTKITFEITVYIKEIDDGYQEIFLSKTRNGGSGNVLWSKTDIEHGSGRKDSSSWAHNFTTTQNISACTDELYILYGAHGTSDDDWYRESLTIKFTLS